MKSKRPKNKKPTPQRKHKKLTEDELDLRAIAKVKKEPAIAWKDFKKILKKDGIL